MSTMMMSNEQIAGLGSLPSRFDVVDKLLRDVLSKQDRDLSVLMNSLAMAEVGILNAIVEGQAQQLALMQQILEAVTQAPAASKFVIDQKATKEKKNG